VKWLLSLAVIPMTVVGTALVDLVPVAVGFQLQYRMRE
jgi:hypothetical protein